MTVILSIIGLAILLVIYFYVTTLAVALGVKTALTVWFAEYLKTIEETKIPVTTDDMESEVMQDIADGVMDETEGNKILRNIRGER